MNKTRSNFILLVRDKQIMYDKKNKGNYCPIFTNQKPFLRGRTMNFPRIEMEISRINQYIHKYIVNL